MGNNEIRMITEKYFGSLVFLFSYLKFVYVLMSNIIVLSFAFLCYAVLSCGQACYIGAFPDEPSLWEHSSLLTRSTTSEAQCSSSLENCPYEDEDMAWSMCHLQYYKTCHSWLFCQP